MEWPKVEAGGNCYGGNHPPGNVMTEEQVEVLRKQIAAYAAISELLVDLHRTVTAQPEPLAGIRFGQCPDPLMVSGHKMTARQRWTPTPVQLQILESYFNQGYGAPTKKRIEEITSELSKHGRITEQNVYNWFQNRRARSKRNLQPPLSLNKESKADVKTQHARGKRAKSVSSSQSNENFSPTSEDHKATIVPTRPFEDHSSRLEACSVQTPERISHSQPLCLDPSLIPSMTSTDDYMKSSANLIQSSFYGSLQDIGFEEASGGYYELIG